MNSPEKEKREQEIYESFFAESDHLKFLKNRGNSLKSNANSPSWSEDYNEEDLQTRFAFYTYKDEPSVLYLSNLFVEEASRKQGLGTKILKAAEKVAETIGASLIELKVKKDSPANAWYRKNGYSYVASENGYNWRVKPLKSV